LNFAGAPPQTPLEELTALLRPQLYFRGLLLRGGRGKRGEGEGKGREGSGGANPPNYFGLEPPLVAILQTPELGLRVASC